MRLILVIIIALFPVNFVFADDENADFEVAPKEITLTECEKSNISISFPFEEKDKKINSKFGWRKLNGEKEYHKGIDIDARCGEKILASHTGLVVKASSDELSGKLVVIQSAQGDYTTHYAHLSRISKEIKKGGVVFEGDVIGKVGETGYCFGPHLHFELRYKRDSETNFTSINPIKLFSDYPIEQLVSK